MGMQLCEVVHLPLGDLQCKPVDTAQMPHQSPLQAQNAPTSQLQPGLTGLGPALAHHFLHITSSRQPRKLKQVWAEHGVVPHAILGEIGTPKTWSSK